MDTRTKIIAYEEAVKLAHLSPVRWVSGHFDPMLAEHARRLRDFAQPGSLLIVVVTNPAEPLLSQRARAELVAALSMVDHVVMKNGTQPSGDPDGSRITHAFIEHVLSKSRAS